DIFFPKFPNVRESSILHGGRRVKPKQYAHRTTRNSGPPMPQRRFSQGGFVRNGFAIEHRF
ncbi:MAG TPA: hypothetical protein VMF64_00415, partial [Steroidobacteraceae bacterium]|nr:hypothetical protein [Steroidobacteraceae bacterium]